MDESSKPNLTLDEPPPGRLRSHPLLPGRGVLTALVLLQLVTLACVLWPRRSGSLPGSQPESLASAGGEDHKQVAQELEGRSLYPQAAQAWERHLETVTDPEQRANVLYRMGNQYLQAEQFASATVAYIRCDQSIPKGHELKSKVGKKLVDCLQRLGMYGEVGREMTRRLGNEDDRSSPPLAIVDGEPLTAADLDHMIERRVDQLLSQQGGLGDPSQRPADDRQRLLRQFSNPTLRKQLFQELLRQELFRRRARELKLDQDDAYLEARHALLDQLLTQRFLDQKLAQVQATQIDLESYYQAHQDRFRIPPSMDVQVIRIAADEDVEKIIQTIQSTEDFQHLAEERASATTPSGGRSIVLGRADPELGNVDALFEFDEGSWTRQAHTHQDQRFLVLAQSKKPARLPPLAEIQDRIEQEYRSQKSQEVIQAAFHELLARYNVEIQPWPTRAKPQDNPSSDAAGTGK